MRKGKNKTIREPRRLREKWKEGKRKKKKKRNEEYNSNLCRVYEVHNTTIEMK